MSKTNFAYCITTTVPLKDFSCLNAGILIGDRDIIIVEVIAEEYLIYKFAELLDKPLDEKEGNHV